MSSAEGMTEEQLQALTQPTVPPVFSPDEMTLVALADAMVRVDADVTDELFARVQEIYDDRQVVEVVFVIGMENMLSSLHRTLRIPSEGFCPVVLLDG